MKSTRRGSFSVHRSEKTPGSKYSSTSGLSPRGHLERQAEFHAIYKTVQLSQLFPGGTDSKEFACNVGDPGKIPGSGRYAGEGNDDPLQPGEFHGRGAWQATVMGSQRVK